MLKCKIILDCTWNSRSLDWIYSSCQRIFAISTNIYILNIKNCVCLISIDTGNFKLCNKRIISNLKSSPDTLL